MGGSGPIGSLKTVEAYNPATNTWTSRADMLTPRHSFGVAAINGILYAVGGDDNADLVKLEAYNPATNTWSPKADMPTARRGLGAAAINNVVYVVGGFDATGALATLEAYQP
jgi:N-acetylneuraminic acid mutarotase